jgi:hypothetical protein
VGMRTRTPVVTLAFVAAVAFTACGGDGTDEAETLSNGLGVGDCFNSLVETKPDITAETGAQFEIVDCSQEHHGEVVAIDRTERGLEIAFCPDAVAEYFDGPPPGDTATNAWQVMEPGNTLTVCAVLDKELTLATSTPSP